MFNSTKQIFQQPINHPTYPTSSHPPEVHTCNTTSSTLFQYLPLYFFSFLLFGLRHAARGIDRRLDFSYFSICKVTALWVQGPRSMSALVSLAARALGSHGRREGGGQGRVVFLVRASAQSLTQPILQSVKHNPGRPVQSTWLPSAGGYAGNHPKLEESSTRVPRQSFAPTSPIKLPKKR